MVKLGAPVFLSEDQKAAGAGQSHGVAVFDPELLAQKHLEKGFTAAYAPKLDVKDTDKIRQTRKAFEKAGIVIAEVGYWENLLDTNEENRKRNHQEMLDSLYIAEELGAHCTVNKLPQVVPMMLEHLNSEEEYDIAAAYVRKCAKEEGITL